MIDLAENAPSHIPKKSRWEHMIWLSADVSKSRLLPLLILADSPDRIRRWLSHDHPEHDGCSSRQGVPNRFGISILWTREFCLAHSVVTDDTPGHCLPSKDILRVVIPQVHFSWPTYWNSYSLSIIRFQKIRYCQLRQLSEL